MVIMILSYEPSILLHTQTQHMGLAVPDTDFHVTCSTDTDSRVTCSKIYGFLAHNIGILSTCKTYPEYLLGIG